MTTPEATVQYWPKRSDRPGCGPARGFSLVELLTVVAVIAVLTSLLAPAFNNIGRSNLLSAEGNRLVNLVQHAGQNSAAKNAMTALVAIPADPQKPNSLSTFGLFEYSPDSAGWKQVSRWETLKEGVVVDFPAGPAADFARYPETRPTPDFPSLTFRGRTISSFRYLVFLPNRSLLQNASAQVRIAEGFFAEGASAPTFTRPAATGDPINYYLVTVLGATGRPLIDRP